MKPDEYHRFWMASAIGLGHPLDPANRREMAEQLSAAGCAVATLVHLIPEPSHEQSTTYFIGNTEAVKALAWAESAELVGAHGLAAALREEASHDFSHEKAGLFDPIREYPDVETHAELREMLSNFAAEHSDDLSADVERHGDRRNEFPTDPKKFHNKWLRAVDRKHDEIRKAEDEADRAREIENLLTAIGRLEKLLPRRALPGVTQDMIERVITAWQEWGLTPDVYDAPCPEAWLTRLQKLISEFPESFPSGMRPIDRNARHAKALEKLGTILAPADAEWLGRLGTIEQASFEETSHRKGVRKYVGCISYLGSEAETLRCGNGSMQIELDEFTESSPLTEDLRAAAEGAMQLVRQQGERVLDALVADYFDRFHEQTEDSPFALYDDDVTSEQLIADIEGWCVQITQYADGVSVSVWFRVPWDDEHGVTIPVTHPTSGSE